LAAAGVLFLRAPFAWDQTCTLLREGLPEVLGVELGVGRCEVDPLTQSLTLTGVSVFTPGAAEPVFAADQVTASLSGVDFWTRRLRIDQVKVRRPRIRLDLTKRTPPSATAKDASLGCPLWPLQRVVVDTLDVQGAEIAIQLPEGRRMELSGLNVGWGTRRGQSELHLETSQGLLGLGAGQKDLTLAELRVEGTFDPAHLGLVINRGELTLEELNVALSGKVEDLCHPAPALEAQIFLPLGMLTKVKRELPPLSGHAFAHVSTRGPLSEPILTAEVQGQGLAVGDIRAGDFHSRLSYAQHELLVDELSLATGPGSVRAAGKVRLSSGFPVTGTVDLKDASFGEILARAGLPGSWVDYLATGHASVRGRLWPVQVSGDLDLKVDRFRLTTHAYDAPHPPKGPPLLAFGDARVRVGYRILPDRAELSGGRVETLHSSALADATLYFSNEGLTLHAVSDALDVSDFGHLGVMRWRGRGGASVEISGPYNAPRIHTTVQAHELELDEYALGVAQGKLNYDADGHLRMPAVTGQKGRTPYTGSVDLDFTGDDLVAHGRVEVADGRVEDLVDVVARLSPHFFSYFQGGLMRGRTSASLAFDSPFSAFDGKATLEVKDLTYEDRRLGEGRMAFTFDHGEFLSLAKSTFHGPLGETFIEGRYGFDDGALDYRLGASKGSLKELLKISAPIGGELTAGAEVHGNSDVPVVQGYVSSPDVLMNGQSLGPLHLEGRSEGQDVQVFGTLFGETHGLAHFKLQEGVPYDATLQVAVKKLSPFLPGVAAAHGLGGILEGTLVARGLLLDSASWRAVLSLKRLGLTRGDFAGQIATPVDLQYAGGRLSVEDVSFTAPNTQLAVSGWVDSQALEVKLRGAMDMRLFESFVPGLERSGGQLELSASASGPLGSPAVVGTASFQDVRLALRDAPVDVRGLSGRAEFSASRILLEDVQGALNEGRLTLRGDWTLAAGSIPKMEVSAQLDEVKWRLGEDLPLTLSGELFLAGRPAAAVLSGDLDAGKLRYDKPVVLENLLAGLLKRPASSSAAVFGSAEKPKEWLTLDVGVRVKEARVENNLAHAKISGNLRLTGTNVRPGLVGTLETGEGSQAFYRGNQFAVTQGILELKDKYGLSGSIDVHAESQVRDYLVRLHAFGPLAKTQVTFDSDPILGQADILSLLTLGVTSRDKGNTAMTGTGLAAEVFLNYSGLDQQVQKFLPKTPLFKDISLHVATAYNDASGLVEPTAQLESKFLVDQLKLRMSQPVSGHGYRAQAEYRIDDRLSAQAQWDNEQADTTYGNLGIDLKLRWDSN
jgi:translocation and assembly module TamB